MRERERERERKREISGSNSEEKDKDFFLLAEIEHLFNNSLPDKGLKNTKVKTRIENRRALFRFLKDCSSE